MRALLAARPEWLTDLARATGLSIEETRKRLILVAALHDLGKFAENFQQKVPELWSQFGHLAKNSDAGHGSVGQTFWNRHHRTLASVTWMPGCSPVPRTTAPRWNPSAICSTPCRRTPRSTLSPLRKISFLFSDDRRRIFRRKDNMNIGASPDGHFGRLDRIQSGLVRLHRALFFPCRLLGQGPEKCGKSIARADFGQAPAAAALGLGTLLGETAQPSPLQAWAERQRPGAAPISI